MKIVQIIQKYKDADEQSITSFLRKNLPQDLLNSLEYDDTKPIEKTLKMLGIEHKLSDEESDPTHGKEQY